MGCHHGNCEAPDVCVCDTGYVGHACDMPSGTNNTGIKNNTGFLKIMFLAKLTNCLKCLFSLDKVFAPFST